MGKLAHPTVNEIIKIKGIVQGVGFRPFVYHLAHKHGLKGWVLNSSEGVIIEVEGDRTNLRKFTNELKEKPPALAVIESIEVQAGGTPRGYRNFEIRASVEEPGKFVPVSPDISICPDCLTELFEPADRRYLYPFINCTNCGPRFTITQDIPYDRKNTTMVSFRMCPECQSEYDDPSNRRFHAQPNACSRCGPALELWNHSGKISCTDPITETKRLLASGKIIAIKGLGGFHLACDARNDQAVAELRRRKPRSDKPFAIMSYDIETIEGYCYVSPKEKEWLASPRRPILLLRKKPGSLISDLVAPHNNYLGVMLPYTPLHYLLLSKGQRTGFLALVMTSGNISEEPICITNDEARDRLKNLADYFLLHNRDIHIRCDDSVAFVVACGEPRPNGREGDREILIRRSRGFAPHPIYLKIDSPGVLACGAELKNTFCLSKGNAYFISQHIGDLENLEAYNFYTETIKHYERFFRIEPRIIAHDLHPDYLSTKYALERTHQSAISNPQSAIQLIAVQHYHAHMVSCMAEHNLSEKVIGVTFDGTGYGTDGQVWGGEFLVGDYSDYQRMGHLVYVPLPGGDTAIKNPYRMTLSFLFSLYGRKCLEMDIPFIQRLNRKEADIILRQLETGVNTLQTSSCGRLFDAVSSLLSVRERVTYEAQAAIELEMMAEEGIKKFYPWGSKEEDDQIIIDTKQIISAIIEDIKRGIKVPVISAGFHNTVAQFIGETCKVIKEKTGLDKVVLSGGVFQNRLLLLKTTDLLRETGFTVYSHQRVPTNDGGISLGQSVIAAVQASRR
jgi:hydrogenase maturation protein HypF